MKQEGYQFIFDALLNFYRTSINSIGNMKNLLHIIKKSILLTIVGIVVYLLYMYLFHW